MRSELQIKEQHALVFIYPEDGRDLEICNLLHEHRFEVQVLEEADTHRHVIEIEFTATQDVMRLVFNKTEDEYPLRRIANEGTIRSISAGIARGEQVLLRTP